MDQKNTIVKCYAKPDCLFNHNGICDNYIIAIGEDGKCDCYVETELTIKETKCCHPDCIHFDDNDMFVGPQCLFKHPEPLKEFYEGMPCDYYHKKSISYVPPKENDQMCWYCDHGRSGRCSLTAKPMRDSNGECCRFTSTGGNR